MVGIPPCKSTIRIYPYIGVLHGMRSTISVYHPICPKWMKDWFQVISNTQVLNVTACPEDDQCLGGGHVIGERFESFCWGSFFHRHVVGTCWHLNGVTNPINGLVNGFPWFPWGYNPTYRGCNPIISGSSVDVSKLWHLEDVVSVSVLPLVHVYFFWTQLVLFPCWEVSYKSYLGLASAYQLDVTG